jgi:hypothetical protein
VAQPTAPSRLTHRQRPVRRSGGRSCSKLLPALGVRNVPRLLKWLAVAVSVRARSPAHNPAQVEDDVLDDAGGVVLVTVWRDEPASPAPGFLSINLVLPVIRQDVAGLAEPQVLALRAVAGQASGVELPEQNVAHKQASVLDGGVKEIAAVDQAEEVAVSGADGNGADTRRKFKPAREIDWGAGPVYTKGS